MPGRRELLIAAGGGALMLAARSWAQARRLPVIGFLSPVVPLNNSDFRLDEFRAGMRELGYVEGKNYRLEARWGEGKLERMPALAGMRARFTEAERAAPAVGMQVRSLEVRDPREMEPPSMRWRASDPTACCCSRTR